VDQEKFHPIGYTSPRLANGGFFVPTYHYHGKAQHKADWDHSIYIVSNDGWLSLPCHHLLSPFHSFIFLLLLLALDSNGFDGLTKHITDPLLNINRLPFYKDNDEQLKRLELFSKVVTPLNSIVKKSLKGKICKKLPNVPFDWAAFGAISRTNITKNEYHKNHDIYVDR